ncbi:hypothetical protein GSI_01157 [Ganoderma sinense ZZ0214-1]|uniref:Uncharacterized protein n=1 Tax=Ganoderma sinense ZZ0214-1 TaxID=1077348 RepID=A0A2G8SUR7_9APHY|nr:hypothetical protein GSI_01157 [Ganoderma sinense ZZ0214-1]
MPPFESIDSFLDDLPATVDQQSCKLLGPTALVVQGLMGILVILSLVYKRHRETPKRPWRIWLFDVSKQIVGQMFVHGLNVLISDIVAHLATENACNLYFLNILLDTTFGVGIIYLILQVVTHILTERLQWKGFESGVYGNPPSISYWFRQAAVYVFALTTMKLVVIALFAALPIIFDLGEWLLAFLGSSNAAQVIFVMGIFPIVMNVLQFWLIDTIVKGSNNAPLTLGSESRRHSLDPDNEPLFRASDDEDDDDDYSARRYDVENPRPRSISRTRDSERLLPGEPKSIASGTTTVIGSGSSSPAPKPIDTGVSAHAYPPAGTAASPTSASSSRSSSSMGSSRSGSSRRRGPPAPLTFKPHKASQPNIEISGSARPEQQETRRDDGEKWAAWGDEDEEDWAERVGEEEWTGRRLEATKDAVDDVWRHSPNANARTVSVA